MSTPNPEHIDAVAGVLHSAPNAAWLRLPGPVDISPGFARAILDSTDPAVHAAMLDALTRHGVLTRAWTVIGDDEDGEEWIVDALWAEREEAEQWTRKHGGHVVGRLHEADWHEVAP